jgi:hypothetical protein
MKKTQFYLSKYLLMLILTFLIRTAYTQETRVSFCENLTTIDAKIGSKISIFQIYNNFEQATLLKTEDGYMLNVVYKLDGVFQIEKRAISDSEVAKICEEYNLLSANQKKNEIDDDETQEARRRLIIASTTFSLGYYSWAIPLSLGADDYKAYTASYMLIGGAGFFVPLIATSQYNITNGMASGFSMGAYSGALHGASLGMVLVGNESNGRAILGLSAIGGITESLIGLSLAKNRNYTWGQSAFLGSGSLWGGAYGAVFPALLFESNDARLYGLSMLATSGLGIWGASALYNSQSITRGDVTYINSTGFLAAYLISTVLGTLEVENFRLGLSLTLLGTSAGLTYGISKTKTHDFTRQQGNLMATGALAGGLIGAGVGILVEANEKTYMWLTAVGATGGFFLTEQIVKDKSTGSKGASNFKIQLNPMGVVGAVKPSILPYKPWDPRFSNSLVNLNLSF